MGSGIFVGFFLLSVVALGHGYARTVPRGQMGINVGDDPLEMPSGTELGAVAVVGGIVGT